MAADNTELLVSKRPEEPTTLSLLLDLQAYSNEVIDILFTRFARRFYRYARRRGASHEDAEDVVQSTFAKVLERIETFDPSKLGDAKPEAWLWGICRHAWIDLLRSQHRGSNAGEQPLDSLPSVDPTPDIVIEDDRKAECLDAAWEALAQADRDEIVRGYQPGKRGRKSRPCRKAVEVLKRAIFSCIDGPHTERSAYA